MKSFRKTFNLILTLVAMLTMAQTAWAATETKTVTFYMDGCTSTTTLQDNWTLVSSEGKVLHYSNNATADNYITLSDKYKRTSFRVNIITCEGIIEFTNLAGIVTKVELTNFQFRDSGMQMYVGLDKADNSKLLHLQGNNSDYDFPSNSLSSETNSATFEGSLDVSATSPLKIMFSGDEASGGSFRFKDGTITITYEVEKQETQDPGHTFKFIASGNTLTATCTSTNGNHHCGLTDRKSTLTLTAEDVAYDGIKHNASLNLTDFIDETGITGITTVFNYVNKATQEVSSIAPWAVGSYTVTATVTIGGTEYTLTTDFNIVEGYKVNNIYSQFSLNKSSALEGEAMTITYTQQMDESLDGLTLTGATSGNNIAYTQSGNTYTFNMPAEDVNLSATFTYPLNENNITQSGDTYTIKTAEGWNYFCQRMEVDADLNGFSGKTVVLGDDITVTTMAGSTDHPFKGMFDGNGHTLTFNYTADRPNCAPFRITNGATIRNLHATGQIDGGIWHYMGGLVGSASGNLTIENCRVSTQISSTINGEAWHGGFVGLLSSQYNQCHITGCVFDGLIYNPEYSGTTYGCGGFVGCFSQYGYAILEDCLFLHGQYDNNNGKHELWWGNENDKNSTFLHRTNNQGEGKLTNCFYVGTHGLKQGSPAVASADAPANFAHLGTPTDHCFMKTYGRLIVFNNKYYTPTYGDLVETYDYSGGKSYNIEYDDKPLGISDITTQLWVPLLRYKRTFTNGKPVTVMMPFNFTKSAFKKSGSSDGLTGHFYEFKGVNGSAPIMESANEVTEMKANTPYLYVPDDEPQYWYIDNSGSGINIFTEGNGGGTKEAVYGDWKLVGSYEPKTWATNEIENIYRLDETLVHMETGALTRPTDGYFQWTGGGDSGVDDITLTATAATVLGESKFVTTFFNSLLHYQLPEGVLAYTAGLDGTQVVFYRIGENSNVIPAGTAVVIVANAASITLTKTTDPGISIASAKNILTGADLATEVTAGKVDGKTPYVLGIAGEPAALGFYKFTGDHIPGGKAYYLATE